MKFMDLNMALKEKVENKYNIVGDDTFLIKQAITNLKSFLVKDLEEFNYLKIDASTASKAELETQILTLPMCSDYRLVVVDNLTDASVKIINNLDLTDSNVVLVCVNAENLKDAEIIDCGKLEKQNISKYILNYLSKYKLNIEEQALDYFIEATNQNMSKVNNELMKLTSYAMDLGTITMEMATNLISNSSEYAIYMLTNAIDKKDYTTYQKIISEMSKGITLAEIYAYMGKYFKRMQYIALNKNDDELSKILGIKPYAIKMSRQNIANNGMKYYLNLYEKYVNLDYKVKSGEISVNNALFALIFEE